MLARASAAGSASSNGSQEAIQCSLKLAAVRAAEQQQAIPLFADAFSAALVAAGSDGGSSSSNSSSSSGGTDAASAQLDALATRFLDEQLLKAVTVVNLERDNTQAGGC
jgi:O-methyltransferase involved in polyketide biosynthesis